MVIDRKFKVLAVNPCSGNVYTEKDGVFFCAKDAALIPALQAYLVDCKHIGADEHHLESVSLLIKRVEAYQAKVECRVPDTNTDCEIARCIHGEGLDG
jgi:hypothetical protein